MLPYHELEYSGFRDVITGLVDRFAIAGANGAKANGAKAIPAGTRRAAPKK
jgi:hypothetical protein